MPRILPVLSFTIIHSLVALLTPASAQSSLTAEEAGIAMAETPQIGNVALSPHGKWVTYTVTRRSVDENTRQTERYLQRVPRSDEAVEEARVLKVPNDADGVQWRPDGECLSMVLDSGYQWWEEPYKSEDQRSKNDPRFVCYDIKTGELKTIPVEGRAVTAQYKWSPSGNYVAFVAPLPERIPLDPRRGVPHGLIEPGAFMGLLLLDVETGAVMQLTPDSMNVARYPEGNFAFAPNEGALVVAIDNAINSWGYSADLVVIERLSRRVRPLVTRPGMDSVPCWSPDGRWIAFTTHQKDPAYRAGWPAFIPAGGGEIVDLPPDDTPMMMSFQHCRWSADSRAFYYGSRLEMTQRLARADVTSRRAAPLPQASDLHLAWEDNRSFSADGRLMVFTRESLTTPPDLFVVALDAKGNPQGAPIQLTDLTPDFALGKHVHTEELSWPSKDGKFTIHGLLLKSASAQGKLPTLLKFIGGPVMVRRGFAQDGWNGAHLPLAARGYAVLIPNTRGRGGYGAAFHDAIGTDKSRGRLPLDDALAGLNLLIESGIADPDRTGVLGHSYGGYMTAYTITQTRRFKAAIIHDGSFFSNYGHFVGFRPGGWESLLWRNLFGVHDPFEPEDRRRIIGENSPGLFANRVKTPTLILAASKSAAVPPYGAVHPNAWRDSGPLYHSLRRFDVPAALLVYDEAHVFMRPAAIADDFTRTGEWLDYWVRGIPFPDPVRAKEYGEEEWGT